jgi:predicted ATPase
LVGRERELGALRDFLDESATRGATLVVSGEPGVGKSALLEAAVARAHDLGQQVVRAAGAEFEVEVTFATSTCSWVRSWARPTPREKFELYFDV